MIREFYLGIMSYIFDVNTSGLFLPEFFKDEYNRIAEDHLSKIESVKLKPSTYQNNFYKNIPRNHQFLFGKHQERGCNNRCSKISQKGLEIRMGNLERKNEKSLQKSLVNRKFEVKAKSRRWAKRQHNWDYTYRGY